MSQKSTQPSSTTRSADQPVLFINGKPADDATLKRVMHAKPVTTSSAIHANQPKPFSILR